MQKNPPWDSTFSTTQGGVFLNAPQIAAYNKKLQRHLVKTTLMSTSLELSL